jgi:hypothetical protein
MNICFVMIQRKSLDFIVMRTFKTQKLVGICVRVCVCYLGLSIGIVSNIYIYIYILYVFFYLIYIYITCWKLPLCFFKLRNPSHGRLMQRG